MCISKIKDTSYLKMRKREHFRLHIFRTSYRPFFELLLVVVSDGQRYFQIISSALKSKSRLILSAITMSERHFDRAF